ncbi:MAG: phosphate ABC transporter permease subunit PstC [Actinobacteria bacterium]|nr:phosphate ABC transporter permease subunit PstC [Actinomycetota bacterium]MSZ57440.1 phosphate ABC transporter permease subunit PstC [Actinomycetota bacterium]
MPDLDVQERRNFSASATANRGDRVFNRVITVAAFSALAVLAGIAIFLGAQTIPVLQTQGLSFLTTTAWDINTDPPTAGIWGMLYGSVVLAIIALVIAVPASLMMSIFMVFLAPKRLASILTNLIDLMAAIPSVILGLWAFYVLNPTAEVWQELLNQYLGWIPLFQNTSGNFLGTPFIAGFVLAIMMIPIVTSVTREVLSRTPPDLINASEALGCSMWTMLRFVALPYGRGGIVGGIMLGLGRALGETIAVFFVLKIIFDTNWYNIIESGGGSVATLIVSRFGEISGPYELQLLLAAGFFLFIMTLIVNVLANLIVNRTGRLQK